MGLSDHKFNVGLRAINKQVLSDSKRTSTSRTRCGDARLSAEEEEEEHRGYGRIMKRGRGGGGRATLLS